MRYDIAVRIAQHYDRPANAGHHLVRLMPLTIPGVQQLVAGTLDVRPEADERADRTDFFANRVVEIAYGGSHDELAFELRCRIDRRVPAPPPAPPSPLSKIAEEVAAVASLDRLSPHHFVGRSPRVVPNAAMTEYAKALVKPDMSALDAMEAIGRALHKDMTFDAKATTVDTSPEDAFKGRRGVCQDFAHIMIACLRSVGVPGGYVSGFLRTVPPPGRPRLSGADAMHAWVKAWCGTGAGWVEFDPTNNLRIAEDHIAVAHGRDYSDVSPVKGVLRTAGAQSTTQAVDVVPLKD